MAFHANTNNGTFRKKSSVPVEKRSVVDNDTKGNAIEKLNHFRTIVANNCASPVTPLAKTPPGSQNIFSATATQIL